MRQFCYEVHLHTAEASKCGKSSAAEMVQWFASLGYAGVFVTDHFLNGNTTVPSDWPWAAQIEGFCSGYEAAKRQGDRLGLDVFFAWEYHYGWAHLLTYGLGPEWLLSYPDLLEWDVVTYLDQVHRDGGFVVHAHPFRESVEVITLIPGKVDAIEVVNCNRRGEADRHARDYAESFGLLQTAGSDIHRVNVKRLAGVTSSERLTGGADYMAALACGDAVMFDRPVRGAKRREQ